mmetsp:Transcript_48447/g.128322  ORF Transcript_48447/g.128322 Transcript_48447/m.128322 type:complete len:88 (-) Transcript_48447:951-1214(-)
MHRRGNASHTEPLLTKRACVDAHSRESTSQETAKQRGNPRLMILILKSQQLSDPYGDPTIRSLPRPATIRQASGSASDRGLGCTCGW